MKKQLKIKNIYSDCCYAQSAAFAVSSKGLSALDTKDLLTPEEAGKYGYHLYRAKMDMDTLLKVDTVIKGGDYERVKKEMNAGILYIDSLGSHQFQYEETPQELTLKFNRNEKVDHVLYYKNYVLYTTYNGNIDTRIEASNKLYILSRPDNKTVVVNLMSHSLPTPDLLLEDINGDGEKEIIVLGFYHLMNHDLAEIAVYKINFN
ncbi:MAG: hypothetical protein ABIO79_17330 [Ferruginibacter sp.]